MIATNVQELRNQMVDNELSEHKEEIQCLKDRQDVIEKSVIRTDTIVTTLCKKLDLLISVLLSGFGAVFIALFTFVIWYIQQPK